MSGGQWSALEIEALLTQRPMSRQQLADALGVHFETVCRRLLSIKESVYIASWQVNDRKRLTPLLGWGQKPDAPRPMLVTDEDRRRRSRELYATKRATQGPGWKRNRFEVPHVTRRIVRRMEIAPPVRAEFRPRRDPMTAMFFGAPS